MPLQLREWYSADERRELAVQEMRPQAEHTADADFGAGFRDHLQPLGGPDVPDPLAWANRRVEFADGNWSSPGSVSWGWTRASRSYTLSQPSRRRSTTA